MTRIILLCLSLVGGPALAQDDPAVIAARTDLVEGRLDEALPVLLAAAEAGDARAQNTMGYAAEAGLGGPADMDAALRWYGLAAAQGYPKASYNIGAIYRWGAPGVPQDGARAREALAVAAAMDYPPAMAEYGHMLVHGEGGPKDVETGLAYLRMGAQLGDSDAMQWLGTLYFDGRIVTQDEAEARRLYEASAAQGNWSGQTNLGVMAEYGRGGPLDPELAADSYRAAMEQGFDMAGANLARLIRSHAEIDPRPLAAEAHCLWAQDLSTREAFPNGGWPAYCRMVLSGLTPEEMEAASAMAEEL